MKNKNRKKVMIVAMLNSLTIVMLLPGVIVILMVVLLLLRITSVGTLVLDAINLLPAIMFVCPIAMAIAIALAVVGIVWSKGGVFDKSYSRTNMKIEIATLVVGLLVVAVFYLFLNIANYARNHSYLHDGPSCNSYYIPSEGIGSDPDACPAY